MKIYAVCFDLKGNILVFTKSDFGVFFSTGNGAIIRPGQLLNGALKAAFPGGATINTKQPEAEARREFLEETGQNIPSPVPATIFTGPGFTFVFFEIDELVLRQLKTDIETIGLAARRLAHDAIVAPNSQIATYQDLRTAYPDAPADDELASVDIRNIVSYAPTIRGWKSDSDIDWFYLAAVHLWTTILKRPPPCPF